VEINPAVGERTELMFAWSSTAGTVHITDIHRDHVLEMACRNHPVPSIISAPAKDKDVGRVIGQSTVCQRSARTFHELDLGNSERNRVPVYHPHAGRRDQSAFKKLFDTILPHCQYN
jgi:hypothetical protein